MNRRISLLIQKARYNKIILISLASLIIFSQPNCNGEVQFDKENSDSQDKLQFQSFIIRAERNEAINHDILAEINQENSIIKVPLTSFLQKQRLIIDFEVSGDAVYIFDQLQISGETVVTLNDDLIYTVHNVQGFKKEYTIKILEQGELNPPQFSGLSSVEIISPFRARLSWDPAIDQESSADMIRYAIYLSDDPSQIFNAAPLYISEEGKSDFDISSLKENKKYFVGVRAVDTSGNIDTNVIVKEFMTPQAASLIISEVYFSDSKVDSFELIILNDGSLRDFRFFYRDKLMLNFPWVTSYRSGDRIVIHSQEESQDYLDSEINNTTYHYFFPEMGSITSTDSELSVHNGNNLIQDYICWVNGEWGEDQKERVQDAVKLEAWFIQNIFPVPSDCIDSSLVLPGQSLQRIQDVQDTNAKSDWFIGQENIGLANIYEVLKLVQGERLGQQEILLRFNQKILETSLQEPESKFTLSTANPVDLAVISDEQSVVLHTLNPLSAGDISIQVSEDLLDWQGFPISAEFNNIIIPAVIDLTHIFINEWADAGTNLDYIELKNYSLEDKPLKADSLYVVFGENEQTYCSLTQICRFDETNGVDICEPFTKELVIASHEIVLIVDQDTSTDNLATIRGFNNFFGKIFLSSETTLIGSGDRLSDSHARLCSANCAQSWSKTPDPLLFGELIGTSTYSSLKADFNPDIDNSTDTNSWNNGSSDTLRSAGQENY